MEGLRDWYKPRVAERNEATTRLQLIDRLLFECLGWDYDQVTAEDSHEGKFADYTLYAPVPTAILEAKREGMTFELPVGHLGIDYSLSGIIRDSKELKPALRQVAGYCQERGVPIGIVSNGSQILAFIAVRIDGIPPLEGRCVAFPSLDVMAEQFLELWNCLSKHAIEEDVLLKRLRGDAQPEIPLKLASTIHSYPGTRSRNVFQTDLQILAEIVLEDVTRSRDLETRFLKECYCPSGALSQDSLVSKTILRNRYASLFNTEGVSVATEPVRTKTGISPKILGESIGRRPILLLGDVGVGKTTFIRWIQNVESADVLEDAYVFYIDLSLRGTLSSDTRQFLIDDMGRQLRDDLGCNIHDFQHVERVYEQELERFAKGIHSAYDPESPQFIDARVKFLEQQIGNSEEHLIRSLEWLSEENRKQVVIFLDNADKRDLETQQVSFLIAQELAARGVAVVFVALRPETFHMSVREGILSAYHPRAFTIAPPRIDRVLRKRLEFALKITGGQIPISTIQGVSIRVGSLDMLLRSFLHTIDQSRDITEAIDNISGGNVRRALDLVRAFMGSGHVDTEKIVSIYERDDSYIIPLHEFLRAVIYGDGEHFFPSRSPVANLFDLESLDAREHFVLPEVISFLVAEASKQVGSGFVELQKVYEHLQGHGYTPSQTHSCVIRAMRHKLIESSGRRDTLAESPKSGSVRTTSLGAYHVARLCKQFIYIDAIVVDTPILDPSTRSQIQAVSYIIARLDRAVVFLDYLDSKWSGSELEDMLFDWRPASRDIRVEIKDIRRRVKKK